MSGNRVLIIDDERLIRRALADYLADCGYETVTAGDGLSGLYLARSEPFDVVLVDLRMPRMDGMEVIRALKAERPDLPVVVVSGTGVLQDVIQAMRQGAWDYVSKPIHDMDEIIVVIDRVLERARLIMERDRYQHEIELLNRSLEAEVARQTQDLRLQNRKLTALNRVSHAISHSLETDVMLERALDAAMAAVEADGGLVRLLNTRTGYLYVAATRGAVAQYMELAAPLELSESLAGEVAEHGHVRVGSQLPDDPVVADLVTAGIHAYIYVPLYIGGSARLYEGDHFAGVEVVGVLGLFRYLAQEFSPTEIELLATIGNQLGLAVTRAQYASGLRRANLQLEEANKELRRLDILREQFIQNVAHELRTPLALVRGHVELLAEGGLTPEQQQHSLDVTLERVQALVELVEAITTLQDLGNDPLDITMISPEELVHTACLMAGQRVVGSGVKLDYEVAEDLPAFPGDFTRLSQSLYQLLDNACKFSEPGTSVSVRAGLSEDQEQLLISVSDEGIGIPEQEHTHIFDRFYQVDGSTRRRYGGVGLGLALVREILAAHRGSVSVTSQEGEGSTFVLTLPLRNGERSQQE